MQQCLAMMLSCSSQWGNICDWWRAEYRKYMGSYRILHLNTGSISDEHKSGFKKEWNLGTENSNLMVPLRIVITVLASGQTFVFFFFFCVGQDIPLLSPSEVPFSGRGRNHQIRAFLSPLLLCWNKHMICNYHHSSSTSSLCALGDCSHSLQIAWY